MSAPTADPIALSGYQLRLPTFEGPLDVLLGLIERQQLAITEVSLVAVTDQFLAHLDRLGDAPPALVADFAAVGARLVLLKSRSLLPRPPAEPDEPAPEDLVRQLVEYRALRTASELLADRDRQAAGAFARGAGVALPEAPPPRLALHHPGSLAQALRRRLTGVGGPPVPLAIRPVITLREMVERALAGIAEGRLTTFEALRRTCDDRQQVAVAFLAVLALIRRRVIEAHQVALFGEIALRPANAASATPLPTAEAYGEAADD